MNDDLRKHRAPFSLDEAMEELGLSVQELVDFVGWSKIPTLIRMPLNRTINIYYENENFHCTPKNYLPENSSFDVKYLGIKNSALTEICLGGTKRIFKFDTIVLETGETIHTKFIHKKICQYLLSQNTPLTEHPKINNNRIFDFFKTFIRSNNKWFGITEQAHSDNTLTMLRSELSMPPLLNTTDNISTTPAPQQMQGTGNQKKYHSGQPSGSYYDFFQFIFSDSLPLSETISEQILIGKTAILFLPREIYGLKATIEKFSRQHSESKKLSKLERLNMAAMRFISEIRSIESISEFWDTDWRSSPITQYLMHPLEQQARDKEEELLKYCIRVLIDDRSLLESGQIELSPRKDRYPAAYSDVLIRLNEAGASELAAPFNLVGTPADKRCKMLKKFGFRGRAAHNLKTVLNGK